MPIHTSSWHIVLLIFSESNKAFSYILDWTYCTMKKTIAMVITWTSPICTVRYNLEYQPRVWLFLKITMRAFDRMTYWHEWKPEINITIRQWCSIVSSSKLRRFRHQPPMVLFLKLGVLRFIPILKRNNNTVV